jgi:hypothetical protein
MGARLGGEEPFVWRRNFHLNEPYTTSALNRFYLRAFGMLIF